MATQGLSQGDASGDSQNATAFAERESGGKAQEEVRQRADDLGHKAQQAAREQIGARKNDAADRLSHVSGALRSTSDTLREEEEGSIARVVDSAAAQIDRAASYLNERSAEELLHDTRQVARRDPALFLGGAALLGMVGARFLRSSDRDGRR